MSRKSVQTNSTTRSWTKATFYGFFLLISWNAIAQTSFKAADEVAKAEKSFAKKAIETNTKQAFLEYYHDSVVVFRNGKAVNGIEAWRKRQADSSELWWQPVFADIAASGDFGYTIGPWEWKKLKTDDKPTAYGYYHSVWKKEKDGLWRVVIDIGIPIQIASIEKNKNTSFSNIESRTVRKNLDALRDELLDTERNFITAYQRNYHDAYNKNLSMEAKICRPYHLPYATTDSIQAALADTSITFTFEPVDGDIATSGDLGYVYGNVKAKGVLNGKPFVAEVNYMRIWKREDNSQWKIVLDVIGGG